jgi:hypothetical protein
MPSPSEAGGPPPEGPEPPSTPTTPGSPEGPEQRSSPEPGSPEGPEQRSAPAPSSPEEALRRLEQRLDLASEAAERLMAQVAAEAARAGGAARAGEADPAGQATRAGSSAANEADLGGDAGGPSQPPPAGWQTPGDEPPRVAPELDPFIALVHTMRDLIPPELQQRLIAALREVLLALRALIDWYLERIDRRREQNVEVQDIPIL